MSDQCGKCRKILPDDQLGRWITLTNYHDIETEAPYKFEYNVCSECWKIVKEVLDSR